MARKKRTRFVKVAYAVLIGFAIISFWRGVWGLLDIYLMPSNYEISLWISVIVGLIILYATKHLLDELM